ncbi:hypothetical protein GOP47_0014283 [Adiantum capillus-veneris]|uniref:RING-type E3 ubiquitin transferase n=1 Tax=Adiantum capillus-veneris TaxID=13818 RepID=A0A9D4ZE06_ADICA|nr:hypothetical protein GOP47_0014283 [Adiantum capillus-veneris]
MDVEQEEACRICRESNEELFYPCACSGSIKFVHQDCLLQWLSHTHAQQCEVCKHPFTFSPVYAQNTPTRLSYSDFISGLGAKKLIGSMESVLQPVHQPALSDYFDDLEELEDLNVEREDDILMNRQPEARPEIRQRQAPQMLEGGAQAGLQGDIEDDMPFYEFIGIRGPYSQLVDHIFVLVLSNGYIFALTIFFPFTLGRGALYVAQLRTFY